MAVMWVACNSAPATQKASFGRDVVASAYGEALTWDSLAPDKHGLTILETTEGGDQIILVHVKEHMMPEPKELDECRGQAIAAYQDHLEKEWIMELRRKYPHDINREALYSLVRK